MTTNNYLPAHLPPPPPYPGLEAQGEHEECANPAPPDYSADGCWEYTRLQNPHCFLPAVHNGTPLEGFQPQGMLSGQRLVVLSPDDFCPHCQQFSMEKTTNICAFVCLLLSVILIFPIGLVFLTRLSWTKMLRCTDCGYKLKLKKSYRIYIWTTLVLLVWAIMIGYVLSLFKFNLLNVDGSAVNEGQYSLVTTPPSHSTSLQYLRGSLFPFDINADSYAARTTANSIDDEVFAWPYNAYQNHVQTTNLPVNQDDQYYISTRDKSDEQITSDPAQVTTSNEHFVTVK